MKRLSLFIVLLLSFTFSYSQNIEKNNKILDKFIEKGMKDWQLPGLSVAVVKDGQVVFLKAYGVRELGKNDKFDINTISSIGSTTKAITVACLGMLVDEGKLKWDDRVIDHFPEFKLHDPYVTANLTIRDLITHRAGMPNTDLLWTTDMPKDEIFRRMEFVEPSYPFRAGYTYQNIMFAVAGEIVSRVSGMPWDQFVKERIFKPLGMVHSVPLMKELANIENKATPHYIIDDKPQVITTSDTDPIAPAGSIWSSANDMSKWLKFMLDSARVDGRRLLKPETYSEILKPQHIIPKESFYPTTALTKPNWTTYGFAWFQHDYRGKMVDFHTGSIGGLIAIIGMIPSENVGVYVLGNMDHAELRHAIMYKVFDLYVFDDNSRDWEKEIFDLYKGFSDAEKVLHDQLKESQVKNTTPTFELDAYTGKFINETFGIIEVVKVNSDLIFKLNGERIGILKHWNYDTFELVFDRKSWGSNLITFEQNRAGKISVTKAFGKDWQRIRVD